MFLGITYRSLITHVSILVEGSLITSDTIELFERHSSGLLDLMDEETRIPSSDDASLFMKLKTRLTSHPSFGM